MVFRRSDEIPMSPRNKRQIDAFVAEELLYEYHLETLDQERAKAVKLYIETDPQMQKKLSDLKYGMTYTEQLSQTTLSTETENRLKAPPTYLSELLTAIQFEQWPTWAKWSSESIIIGGIVAVVVSFVPWHLVYDRIENKSATLVLAEVDSHNIKTSPLEEGSHEDTPLFADDKVIKPNVKQDSPKTPAVATSPTSPPHPTPAPNSAPVANVPTPNAVPAPVVNTALPTPAPTVAPVVSAGMIANASKNTLIKNQGFLYRGTLYVSNLEATSLKLTKLIEQNGGRKAGSVPLGWSKDTEKYFHFTIPSAQIESLQKDLSTYGKYTVSKEKHPRIMPEGISRVIISVFEAAVKPSTEQKNPAPAPTPVTPAIPAAPTTVPAAATTAPAVDNEGQ